MGVPTSEVGYTSAMPRREDHEVHKDMWGIEGGKLIIIIISDKNLISICCCRTKLCYRYSVFFQYVCYAAGCKCHPNRTV